MINRALRFATICHAGQKRKYTGENYINHPIAVSNTVGELEGSTTEMICAALLHDVVEDTEATIEDIGTFFGADVCHLVYWLTDKSTKADGNREARKKIDREHIAQAPAAAQTIKLADLIDNSSTILELDPDFAKVYLAEKKLLLEVLTKGATELWTTANAIIHNYERGER